MRGVSLAAIAAIVLLASHSDANAKKRTKQTAQPCVSVIQDDRYPNTEGSCFQGATFKRGVYKGAQKPKVAKPAKETQETLVSKPNEPSRGLVQIQCGPRAIEVAYTASTQFSGFCRDFYSSFKFKAVGGWRPGRCWVGGKHPCGGAVDISQSCRSRGPGHCLPRDFPVGLSEQLADKWGLHPGSRWGHRDVGHFETKGTLAGNGWPAHKVAAQEKALQLASVEAGPPPRRWPYTYSDIKEMKAAEPAPIRPANGKELMLPYYIHSDIVAMNPAKIAMDYLHNTPRGSPIEEINRAANLFEIDAPFMRAIARIESSFDPKQRTGSYIGLFQLSKFEFNRYGGGGDITDARANAIAAAHKFAVEGARFEYSAGRKPSFSDLYLIHQQGEEGAAEHVARPERLAWQSMCATDEGKQKGIRWCKKAIWGNSLPHLKAAWKSVEKLPSWAFVQHWRERVNKFVIAGAKAVIPQANAMEVASAVKYKPKKKRHAKRAKRIKYAQAK